MPEPKANAIMLMEPARFPYTPLQFVLKTVSRCNLNCSYCYVYNKGDTTWKSRPTLMSDSVLDAALHRIKNWCLQSGQSWVKITFHGGEPLLAGVERYRRWCARIHEALDDVVQVSIGMQTNATLIDAGFVEFFRDEHIELGVSIDGPPDIHDRFRVDHQNRGSYADVARGIGMLRDAGLPVSLLSVIPFGEDGCRIHQHFLDLGASSVSYLLPDYTHDTIGPVRAQFGATPCADFLLPIFDQWWSEGALSTKISLFWNIARLVLGGDSIMDLLGNKPFGFLFIETDGSIEDLDVLRVCRDGMAGTGLNVAMHDFEAIGELSELHRKALFTGMPVPTACGGCSERETCSGGYLPHRYSIARTFDNPSVWCADILKLFAHIRTKLEVTPDETLLRRQVLAGMEQDALIGRV